MARSKKETGPLPTIWHASDELWEQVKQVLAETTDERGITYVYDAWNRMTSNSAGGGDWYTYDALGRRPGTTKCSGRITDSYYSADWQGLEDDTTGPADPCLGPFSSTSTYVWSLSYVDDMVERDYTDTWFGFYRVYVQSDANHNVTAILNTSGSVFERFTYDPYGSFQVRNSSWTTTTDTTGWSYFFQGGKWDPDVGLYNFRYRDYSPTLGRWMEQDPAGYVDGANVYQMELGNPVDGVDPFGLWDWGSVFDSATNAAAGFGDSLSFGATNKIRDWTGLNDYVDQDSNSYLGGSVAGTAYGMVMPGTAAGKIGKVICAVNSAGKGGRVVVTIIRTVQAGMAVRSAYVAYQSAEEASKDWHCDKTRSTLLWTQAFFSALSAFQSFKSALQKPRCFVAGTKVLMAGSPDDQAAGSYHDWRYWAGGALIVAGPVGYLVLTRKERKRRAPGAQAERPEEREPWEPAWVPLVPESWLLGHFARRQLVRRLVSPLLRPYFALEGLDRRW